MRPVMCEKSMRKAANENKGEARRRSILRRTIDSRNYLRSSRGLFSGRRKSGFSGGFPPVRWYF
jgi:hypothetical protein